MNPRCKIQILLGRLGLLGVASASGVAMFGGQASLAAGFSDGTVTIKASLSSASFSLTDMVPGDVRYGEYRITNAGSREVLYGLSTSTTNPDGKSLAGQLHAEVRKVRATCDASTFAASSDTIASVSKLNILATAGVRALGVGASEIACFKVSMPSNLGNRFQGATTAMTVTFDAIQAAP